MPMFRILAQSYTTSQRIAKLVRAMNANEALYSVGQELDDAGYFPISAVEV